MDEITFDDKTYVSSKRAAQITGYAKDYIGQLCREGRVEARLVGRNWYVLEASIREHRFGPDPSKTPQKEDDSAWESAQYAPEAISTLPTVESAGKDTFDHTNTVQEMQNAWQDWFSRKNDVLPAQLEEQLLEDPEIIETREEIQSAPLVDVPAEQLSEDPAEVVHLVKVAPEPPIEIAQEPVYTAPKHFDIQMQEESVPVYRSSIPEPAIYEPLEVPESRHIRNAPPMASREPLYGSPRQEGRILRERRVKKNKRPSVALQALFLSIAGIAIAIALIGSGQADAFLNQNHFEYAPINFLGGEIMVNKANK